mmetsp:Transcript_16207/g.21209  ORF Transcript_16207/g.21209 Transcript_16207/m.21209 type:complete len:86 (+) Transcript_16207:1093-1350(+)
MMDCLYFHTVELLSTRNARRAHDDDRLRFTTRHSSLKIFNVHSPTTFHRPNCLLVHFPLKKLLSYVNVPVINLPHLLFLCPLQNP